VAFLSEGVFAAEQRRWSLEVGWLFLVVFVTIFCVFFSLSLEAVRAWWTGGACAPTSGSRQRSDRPTNGMRV